MPIYLAVLLGMGAMAVGPGLYCSIEDSIHHSAPGCCGKGDNSSCTDSKVDERCEQHLRNCVGDVCEALICCGNEYPNLYTDKICKNYRK